MLPLTLSDGTPLTLGPRLGKGGEGEVYDLVGAPRDVCKLYLSPLTPDRERKLMAMVARSTPALTRIAAWPTRTVHRGGKIVGFLMPRLSDHKELHKLSHPMDRLKTFPEVGYDFLVHVATNIARAFKTLHAHGLVVGDVNESGIMVARDGTVMFIDCDSMQITVGPTPPDATNAGETFTCDVGKPEFQPPEIINHHKSFRGILRTPDHDAFGLAVAIFQLLFFGWHPFSVRMLDGEQQPTADNIKAGRFAFGRDFYATEFTRPPHALEPDALPTYLRDLIDRAFSSTRTGPRPTPDEWENALERLAMESVTCSRYMTHVHHPKDARCPFCVLDLKLGFAILPHIALDAARLKAIWAQIQSAYFELSAPTPAPDLPLPDPPDLTPTSSVAPELIATAHRGRLTTRLQLGALLLLALAFVHPALLAVAPSLVLILELHLRLTRPPAFRALRGTVRDHRVHFGQAERALQPPRDAGLALNYDDGKRAYEAIQHHDERRSAALFRLHERLVDQQTRAWLAQHTLRKAGLAAIPGRILILLEKRGITNAADVETLRKRKLRGVDADHVKALTRWEYGLLNRFVPDLEAPGYRDAIEALHRRLDDEHASLMHRLILARDWLTERLVADRRRRADDLTTYRDRFATYAQDLVVYQALSRRW